MCITIYQGVVNIDDTLIRAARVLGAKDKDIFVRVIVPASLPFILTAVRLGASKMCIRDRCYAQNRLPNLLWDGCPQILCSGLYRLNQ